RERAPVDRETYRVAAGEDPGTTWLARRVAVHGRDGVLVAQRRRWRRMQIPHKTTHPGGGPDRRRRAHPPVRNMQARAARRHRVGTRETSHDRPAAVEDLEH